jgi:hypothetical protein
LSADESNRLLRELLDRTEIVELIDRLGRWLDEKQFNDPVRSASMFVPELVVETPGGKATGIPAAIEMARKHHWYERTQHLHTNVIVRLKGDEAEVEANLLVTFVPDAAAPETYAQAGTHYYFRVVRDGGVWKFASIADQLIWRKRLPPDGTPNV